MPRQPPTPEKELMKAAKAGDLAKVRQLLADEPALSRSRDAAGATPLHQAAWKGHAEIAALLLDAGADLAAQWEDGHVGGTPLHAAAHGNQRAVAELLIARGADVRATSCNGRTVMNETTVHNAKTVANLLRKHGVE